MTPLPLTTSAASPRVWALSDLHWSTSKPMTRYGYVWDGHRKRIQDNWRSRVRRQDLVLVPGDISFANKDPHRDLADLHLLPGQKVFVPGNHDRWAQGITVSKMAEMMEPYPSIHALTYGKPYYETGRYLIVGYKGSEPQETGRWVAKHFNKTLDHARNVVAQAEYARASDSIVIVTTHYAPSVQEREILAALSPALWLHGHAHVGGDDAALVEKWQRERDKPRQICISADYLNMIPLEVTGGVVWPHV